jgi:hypothetical protein
MSEDFAVPLNALAGTWFYAVAFFATYLQLQFQGPQMAEYHNLTLEVPPRIRVGERWIEWGEPGYRDALCDQFGATVHRAETDVEGEQIVIEFESGVLVTMSLRVEDLDGMEGPSYSHSGAWGAKGRDGSLWTAEWKDDWQRLYTAKQ